MNIEDKKLKKIIVLIEITNDALKQLKGNLLKVFARFVC